MVLGPKIFHMMLLNMVQAVANKERFVGGKHGSPQQAVYLEEVILPPTVDFNPRT